MPDAASTDQIRELDSVVLTRAVKEPVKDANQVYMPIGSRGVVVHVYANGLAYEVEFYTTTYGVLTVEATDLKKVEFVK